MSSNNPLRACFEGVLTHPHPCRALGVSRASLCVISEQREDLLRLTARLLCNGVCARNRNRSLNSKPVRLQIDATCLNAACVNTETRVLKFMTRQHLSRPKDTFVQIGVVFFSSIQPHMLFAEGCRCPLSAHISSGKVLEINQRLK